MEYSPDELQIIRDKYPTMGIEISELLPGHSRSSIQDTAKRMGVKVIVVVPEFHIHRDDAIRLAMAIDCEGTIGLWKRSQRTLCYNPHIMIYNTNYLLIEWIKSVISTIPYYIYTDDREHKIHKIAYSIAIRGIGPTYALLKEVIPFLILKGDMARLLSEYDSMRIWQPIRQPISKRDHEIFEELRKLTKKGQ